MYLEMYLRHKGAERRTSRRWSRQSSRRGSSPFLWEPGMAGRRRLSSYTISSGDFGSEFAMDVDDMEQTEEEVKENIRMNKNIIDTAKQQPWPMKKKYKMLKRAKAYVKKHEGELAQSKQAKDIFAKYSIFIHNSWHRLQRKVADLMVTLTPWEMRIKRIESHFGSVVASYFIFLRWVFWLNCFITVFVCCFLMVPEVLRGDDDPSGMRKQLESEEMESALNLQAIWEFEGYLKYSPIFYGYYSNRDMTEEGYRLPLAYLLSSLTMYIFSFFVILRKMAKNSRQSKMTEKEDECAFTWKLFSGWDFMIGNSETAHNKVASLVMSFKEVILEEHERKKEERSWKIISLRVLANLIVLTLLVSSAYAVVLVVERQEQPEAKNSWYRQNEVTIVINMISIVYPNLFDMIGYIEQYHPRIQLRWQLARILVLYLLNLYSLIFAQFRKVMSMTNELVGIRENITYLLDMGLLEPTLTNITMFNINATSSTTATSGLMSVLQEAMTTAEPFLPSLAEALTSQYYYPGTEWNQTNCTMVPINCTLLRQFGVNFTRGPVPISSESLLLLNDTVTPLLDTLTTTAMLPLLNLSSGETRTPASEGDSYGPGPQVPSDAEGYDALFWRIANFTVIGVANWTYRYPSGPDPNISIPVIYVDNYSKTANVTDEDPNSKMGTFRPPWKVATPFGDQNDTTVPSWTEWTSTIDPDNCTVVYVPVCNGATDGPFDFPTWTSSETTRGSSTTTTTEIPRRKPGSPLLPEDLLKVEESTKERLRKLCWETMFGQEIVKLTVMDVVMTIGSTVVTDFIRALIVRYANDCWCWDLEQGFPGYGDFKIAENILHLVNNQGMVWMGMFFSPGLPAINTVKLCILMYVRSWAVLTCNIPHETVFKASGSNNFYFMLLIIMLFVCTLPVGYAMVWLEPSWHCGPFSGYFRAYRVFTTYLDNTLPSWMNKIIEYLTSPGVVIPLILLLVLIIYYLVSLAGSLRESNNDLKLQLRREKDVVKKPAPATATTEGGLPETIPETNIEAEATKAEAEKATDVLQKWGGSKRPVFPTRMRPAVSTPEYERKLDMLKREGEDTPPSTRGRKVQYNLQHSDEEPLVDGHGHDTPMGSRTPLAEKKLAQSPRTPKPLLKSIAKLRHAESQEGKRERDTGGEVDVPAIALSRKEKSTESSDDDAEPDSSHDPPPHGTYAAEGEDICPRETLPLLEIAEGLQYPVLHRSALVRDSGRGRWHEYITDPRLPRVNVCPPTPLHDHDER
ncbi:transmembrane channel-like protein [Ornithodoros turicata]|uniref:transmembrane channel-like protein n=1 Tax=Ornithodoros turicata TaxID=34597 RepID=UPI00313A3B69